MSIQWDTTVIDLMLSLQMLLVQEEVIRMGPKKRTVRLKCVLGREPPVVRTGLFRVGGRVRREA